MRSLPVRVFALLALLLALLATSAARSAEDDEIQAAIKNGVAFLQGAHKPGATYAGGSHGLATASLAGMALLESGVPETDPAVANIVQFVRDHALTETATYHLSLTIMFLDRLGQECDRPIIQLLGIRLMAGQGATGGWSYQCNYPLSEREESRLKRIFVQESRLRTAPPVKKKEDVSVPRPDLPPLPAPAPVQKAPPAPPKVQPRPVLHPEVARWARMINETMLENGKRASGGGDNSNTQFGALALWCTRKHGVPCDRAIDLLDRRFRVSQAADGGWSYIFTESGSKSSSPSTTCAGLLGLAEGHGMHSSVLRTNANPAPKNGRPDPIGDVAIKAGLKCLAGYIADARGPLDDAPIKAKRGRRFKRDQLSSNLYFLWSMERVAVIYGLDTIGKTDWYDWGADALVGSQFVDGSWLDYGQDVGTSFALLFLNRANAARDLTTILRGKVKDPGVATLRGGSTAKIDPRLAPTASPAQAAADNWDLQAARLSASLLAASAVGQSQLLARFRDTRGSVYTETLARVAAKATGPFQSEVRKALAQRLTRMTETTLRNMLVDDNREVRAAAACACGKRAEKQLIPDLVEKLADAEPLVVQASRASLQALAGTDFGPQPGSTPLEAAKAILEWKAWLKEQEK